MHIMYKPNKIVCKHLQAKKETKVPSLNASNISMTFRPLFTHHVDGGEGSE